MVNSLPLLTTNQGVVGSIPASRTKKEKPVTTVTGFFLFWLLFFCGRCHHHGLTIEVFCALHAMLLTP